MMMPFHGAEESCAVLLGRGSVPGDFPNVDENALPVGAREHVPVGEKGLMAEHFTFLEPVARPVQRGFQADGEIGRESRHFFPGHMRLIDSVPVAAGAPGYSGAAA